MRYEIKSEEENTRIDKYLSENFEFSRSFFKNLIDQGLVFVNGETVKSSYKLAIGDLIVFDYKKEEVKLIPKDIKLNILYEDDEILIINKPKNLVVHPGDIENQDTLVNGLIYKYKTLGNMNSIRPGIVHRLDKDTSGLLVIAKTDTSYNSLVSQFSKGTVLRKYKALVHGKIENNSMIDKPIGRNERNRIKFAINYKNGKSAISIVKPLEIFNDYTLIEVELKTGRTHQIRVHLNSIGHPVVGDLFYGKKNEFGIDTHLLHAYSIGFVHPVTMQKLEFKSEVPKEFEDTIRRLRDEENFKCR